MTDLPIASNWCFHTGLASSGTSGLVKLLNGHPEALILREGLIWTYTDMLGEPKFRPTPASHLINHEVMLEQAGFDEWPPERLRAFFEGVRQMVAPRAVVFGDKATLYAQVIDDLQAVFPGCKLLHTVRETWDHVASIYEAQWWREQVMAKNGPLSEARLAVKAYQQQRWWARKIAGHVRIVADAEKENALIVRFEDLAERPRETMVDVLNFMGLDVVEYDWSVLETVHYAGRVERWQECNAIVELRERLEE